MPFLKPLKFNTCKLEWFIMDTKFICYCYLICLFLVTTMQHTECWAFCGTRNPLTVLKMERATKLSMQTTLHKCVHVFNKLKNLVQK